MDFSFIIEEEEEDSFSSLSSEALTRVLLLLFLSFRFVFFVNVCFVVVVVVVVIEEEGGRTPLPLRRRPKAPRPPRGQKNAAFSEKAEDDANIIVVIKVRVLRASVCALNGPHFALCV
jgi:hypothetical protein